MTLAMNSDLSAALAGAGALARFKASRPQPCASSYVCEDVEVGDRVVYLPSTAGPVVVCEGCAERIAASVDLAAIASIGDEPVIPTSVAEAELALRTEWEALGQYRPETVAALLGLLDRGAEDVARVERERWAFALRRTAARLGDGSLSYGVRMAVRQIEKNEEPST